MKHIVVYSILVCITSFLILIFFIKNLSKFIGYIGAGTGLFLIYIIPLGVNTIYYRIKHPASRHIRNMLLAGDNFSQETNSETKINDIQINPNFDNDFGLSLSEKPPSAFKDNFFYFSQIVLILFGVFTLILQFVPINFFGIKLDSQNI